MLYEVITEDIERMREIVREALEAGALGFSTSRTLLHRAADLGVSAHRRHQCVDAWSTDRITDVRPVQEEPAIEELQAHSVEARRERGSVPRIDVLRNNFV